MKKLAVSALAIVLACPAFAGQQSDSSFTIMGLDPYIGLRAGMGYNNLNYDFNGKKKSIEESNFRGRVAMGLEICDTVRSEIEWSIFSKTKDTKDFNGIDDVKVSNKLQTLMWNSYWEFGNFSMIRPFIGAGIGMGFADTSHESDVIGKKVKAKHVFQQWEHLV